MSESLKKSLNILIFVESRYKVNRKRIKATVARKSQNIKISTPHSAENAAVN